MEDMLTHNNIVNAVKKAASQFPLTKAAYFSSYAEHLATEESDLDLLVEFEQSSVSILIIISLKHFLEDQLSKSVVIIHAPIPETAIIEIGKQVSVL